jgi:hypothetical protein
LTDNIVTDSRTQVPEPYQTKLKQLWQTANIATGQSPLTDGQAMFVAEAYFNAPDLSLGTFASKGAYARWFF